MVSDKKIPINANVKYVTPRAGPFFGAGDIIHKVMLHTKYYGSSLMVSYKKIFSCFSLFKSL